MSVATIRAAMKAALETVANVGKVNAFEPLAVREEDFKTCYVDRRLGYVLGWSIARESAEETRSSHRTNLVGHTLVVRGVRALAEGGATDTEFQGLVDAVLAVMRKNQVALYGASVVEVGPPQLRITEPRTFAGYTVHYCEIAQRCAEQVDLVPQS